VAGPDLDSAVLLEPGLLVHQSRFELHAAHSSVFYCCHLSC
jgi:hypothetical protein